jgi:uncharacterized membrane protein
MRLYGLDKQSLWYDEVIEENVFTQLFINVNPAHPENTPPLNSFFLHLMKLNFPHSDFALRIVPFTFGLTSIPLMFLLGRRLFNENVGLLASFLLSISPFHIWYSQDARMYTLQWMLALLSLIFFLRAFERPSLGNYIGFTISNTAGLYTHQLAVFLFSLQGLYLLLFSKRYKIHIFRWISAFSAVLILYSPWIIYSFTSLMDKPAGSPKPMDLTTILYTIFSYTAGFSIGPSLRELHIDRSLAVIKPYLPEIVPFAVVYGTLFIAGLLSILKDRPRFLFLLLLQTVPMIGVIILNSVLSNISYNVRYVGSALFAFLLFVANGINWLLYVKYKSGRILAIIAIIAVTGLSGYSYTNYQFDNKYHKEDIRGAVAYINENKAEDDLALCIIDEVVFNRYSEKYFFYCKGYPYYADVNSKISVENELRKMVEGKKRLWLVLSHEWYHPNLANYSKAWLDANYKEIQQLHKGFSEIANIRIYCYDLTSKKS